MLRETDTSSVTPNPTKSTTRSTTSRIIILVWSVEATGVMVEQVRDVVSCRSERVLGIVSSHNEKKRRVGNCMNWQELGLLCTVL